MRTPASFNSGWATSLMPGKAGLRNMAARSRRGLRFMAGARGASTIACSAAGGNW